MIVSRRDLLGLRGLGREGGFWTHVYRRAMACRFEVTFSTDERGALQAAQAALDEIDRLESQLSVFREDSEVSALNRNAASCEQKVEAGLFELLDLCRRLSDETEGAFDITSGPLTRAWGFLSRQGRLPSLDERAAVLACVGMRHVELNPERLSVRYARAGVDINLGSIGKGYALDRAAEVLKVRGVSRALLSGGSSSVLALGSGTRAGWVVGVRDPRRTQRRMARLHLRDAALATSGQEEQHFMHEGRRLGHILDPRTGEPAQDVLSATVVSDRGRVADALATAFFVGGRAIAETYCARHPNTLVLLVESAAPRRLIALGAHSGCLIEPEMEVA